MQYRKKPVVIDAVQYDGSPENRTAVLDFTGVKAQNASTIYWRSRDGNEVGEIVIRTLEGDMVASPGDWIIKGPRGRCIPASRTSSPRPMSPPDDHSNRPKWRATMGRLRAKRDCPNCKGVRSMHVIFLDDAGREAPSVSGASKSVWHCTICGQRAEHQ